MIRITAAASETILAAANQYAMVIGLSEAEEDTYIGLNWQDAQGNLYAATSFLVRPEWLQAAQAPLVRPAWDTGNVIDMALAVTGQAALRFSLSPIVASPSQITAIGGMDSLDAMAAMGLTIIDAQDAGMV